MKKITKGKEPSSLISYRSSIPVGDMEKSNIYDDYKENGILRKQLLEEQGFVCCYCLSRISVRNSKIEHFKAQSIYRSKQIEYSNLFVACKGGEGTKEQHCDTAKANKELHHIELYLEIEKSIKYTKHGNVSSLTSTIDAISDLTTEINDTLNLNARVLIKNRKQTYEDFKNSMRGKWSKSNLEKAITYYRQKHNGKYAPYSEMMVYLLSQKLKAQK